MRTPNVARRYDYFLGGKDNFEADRAAADEVTRFFDGPGTIIPPGADEQWGYAGVARLNARQGATR